MIRRLVRALWALGWLVVLLGGLPFVLVRYVGWPLPHRWPTTAAWQRWVAQPVTRTTMIDAAAIAGWLLWALLVYAVLVEVLNRARRATRWAGRVRLPALPTPMQATAGGMLGAAVFGVPAAAQQPVPPAASPPPVPPAALSLEHASPVGAAPQAPPADRVPPAHRPAAQPATPPGRNVITLPDGGWISHDTATAVASAAALVWLHRRRRYLPGPPAGSTRTDADLAPLPDTVAAIQDRLRRQDPTDADTGDAPEDVASTTERGAATAGAGVPAGEPPRPADLPPGGVGLTGPGAADAGRGLLVATLASRHRGHDAHLITTVTDLRALLGPDADRHRATTGLTVADNLDDALAHLEREVLHRSQERPVGATTGVPEPTGHQPAPLVVVTASPADPASARRLAVVLTLAAPLGITGVLLGEWPHGATWRVDDGGTIHLADTPARGRLSVLTSIAAADLLDLFDAVPHTSRMHPADGPRRLPDPFDGDGDVAGAADDYPHDAQLATRRPTGIGPSARARLRLRVLGTPSIRHADSGAPVSLRRSAAVQILVLLAVHRDGATTGQLTAALWPGLRPQAAANRLYTPISSLRTTLHQAAGVDVVVRDGDRYRLDDRHIDVDLWRWHAVVDQAATALDPADRQRALRAVVDGYTDDLAARQQWPWLPAHREAARRHVVDAYAALAAITSEPRAALALLQDAIRVDPYNEELHRRAMRGYADAGDSPAARRILADFTKRLVEMGMEAADTAQ